jgi:predicted MFS family arabinose efflux permease
MAEQTQKPRRPFTAGVWRNRDFVKLWSGQAFSQFGAQVSLVVVPLLAIDTLAAGPDELGLLGMLARLPALLYLVVGVWIDRMPKHRTLVVTNLARAVLLLMLPVEAAFGVLSIGLLGATLLISGVLTVFFDTAYLSFLPGLAGREHLVEANSRMESARATAQFVGPSVGGLLVQAVTARIAIIVDGLSLLCSGFLLSRIRHRDPLPVPESVEPGRWRRVRGELAEGLRFLARHAVLGPLMLAVAIDNIVWSAEVTLYVIYLVSVLHLPASLVGLSLIGMGPGAIAGALAAGPVARRIGLGATVVTGLAGFCLSALLIPLAPANAVVALPMLIAASFLMAASGQLSAINVESLCQATTPDRLLGRVLGAFRFLTAGLWPVGALAGGLVGGAIGPRAALLAAVVGMAIAPVLVWFSPVRRLVTAPVGEAG